MKPSRSLVLLALAACAGGEPAPSTYSADTSATGVVTIRNTRPAAWSDSSTQWRVTEVARVGGSDDSANALINPLSMTLDAAGRLVVSEFAPPTVSIVGLDGSIVRRVGREGQGPGEYLSPNLVRVGEFIVVDDPRVARLSVFDTAGTLVGAYPAPCCYYARVYADTIDHAYVKSSPALDTTASDAYLRIDVRTGATDTLMLQRIGPEPAVWEFQNGGGGFMRWGIPFQPADVTGFTPDGHVLRAWGGAYRYVETSITGDTIRIVEREWSPLIRPEADRRKRFDDIRESLVKQMGEANVNAEVKFSDIPEEVAPILSLTVDGRGFVWVPSFSADSASSFFDIFTPGGLWLGTLATPWPGDESVSYIGRDHIVTQGETEDGFPFARVWEVDRRTSRGGSR